MEDIFFGSPWKAPEWGSTKDKVFKNIWQIEQSPEKGKTLLLEKGLSGHCVQGQERAGCPPHSLLGGWHSQAKADSILSRGAQLSHSPQSRWHLVWVNTGRYCLSFTRAFLSIKGLKGL